MTARISRSLLAGLAGVAVIVVAPSLAANVPQDAGLRTLYVSVVNTANGAPTPGMTAADFTVKEDGKVRQVVKVERATEPVYYVLLVDTTQVAKDYVQYMREALTTFINAVLTNSPDSQIGLAEFGGAGMITTDLTSDRATLDAAIPKLLPKDSEPVFNEAMVEAAKRLSKVPGPRRVIVTLNFEPNEESSSLQVKQVAEEVRKSEATVWAVSVRKGAKQDANRDALLKGLAANSGGIRQTLLTPVPLPQFMLSIAANSLAQYAVTINHPAGDNPAKMTQVTVNRQGLVALTRMWSGG